MTSPHPAPVTGPFETEREALELPAVRAIYDAMHASLRRGVGDEENLRLLEGACQAADVELGAYDARILRWLAGWEAQMCAVVAGLITRAAVPSLTTEHLGRVLDALDFAADELGDRVTNCSECSGEWCTTCQSRLTRVAGWDATTEALRGQQ